MRAESTERPTVERFHRICADAVKILPFGLNSVVPPTFVGFVIINSFTFAVDVAIMTVLHGGLAVPLAAAVTVGYAASFTLAYYLNRAFNFRSHAPVGRQLAFYVPAVVVNYLAFILGASSALATMGVEYHLARVVAGGCEALYMYSALRWVVFRR